MRRLRFRAPMMLPFGVVLGRISFIGVWELSRSIRKRGRSSHKRGLSTAGRAAFQRAGALSVAPFGREAYVARHDPMHGLLVSARLTYLPGGLLFYILGVFVGAGPIRWWQVVVGLVIVTLVHVLTHYINDAEDVATDNATTHPTVFTGGSRAIQRGLVTPRRLRVASAILALVTLALIAVVATLGNNPVAAGLFAAALFFAYSYSGRPLMLGRYGLGEVTAAGVMAVLVPVAGAATAGGYTRALWPLVALLFAQTFFARLCTAYPDIAADRATQKWTLTALVGERGSAVVFGIAAVANFLVGAVVATGQTSANARLTSGCIVALASTIIAILIATKRAQRKPVWVPMIGLGATAAALVIITLAYV